jgi:hypothetical protein
VFASPGFDVGSAPEAFAADLGGWGGEVVAVDVAPGGAAAGVEELGDLGDADEVEVSGTHRLRFLVT